MLLIGRQETIRSKPINRFTIKFTYVLLKNSVFLNTPSDHLVKYDVYQKWTGDFLFNR